MSFTGTRERVILESNPGSVGWVDWITVPEDVVTGLAGRIIWSSIWDKYMGCPISLDIKGCISKQRWISFRNATNFLRSFRGPGWRPGWTRKCLHIVFSLLSHFYSSHRTAVDFFLFWILWDWWTNLLLTYGLVSRLVSGSGTRYYIFEGKTASFHKMLNLDVIFSGHASRIALLMTSTLSGIDITSSAHSRERLLEVQRSLL
jgi:hypothetical protein